MCFNAEEAANALTMALPIHAFIKNRGKQLPPRLYEVAFVSNMAASLAFHTAAARKSNPDIVNKLRTIDIACIHTLCVTVGAAALPPHLRTLWTYIMVPANMFSFFAHGGVNEHTDKPVLRTAVTGLSLSPLIGCFNKSFLEVAKMLTFGSCMAVAYTHGAHPLFHVFLGPFVGSITRLLRKKK